jgi:hypothetical protein
MALFVIRMALFVIQHLQIVMVSLGNLIFQSFYLLQNIKKMSIES